MLPSRAAAVGRLCEKCDGKCPVCDSYVRPCVLVRICDECNYGSYQVRACVRARRARMRESERATETERARERDSLSCIEPARALFARLISSALTVSACLGAGTISMLRAGSVRHLRRTRHLGRILLQGVHQSREGCEYPTSPTQPPH